MRSSEKEDLGERGEEETQENKSYGNVAEGHGGAHICLLRENACRGYGAHMPFFGSHPSNAGGSWSVR